MNIKKFKKPLESVLRKKLSQLEYEVTQEERTEPPFHNKYWNFTGEGIYVDIVSGEPLFSSRDKFDSGCGWPSFTKPLLKTQLNEKIEDQRLITARIEVRSQGADSHLGHVFDDGPEALGGLRYCINSAAIRFVALEDMNIEGYSAYLSMFIPVTNQDAKRIKSF